MTDLIRDAFTWKCRSCKTRHHGTWDYGDIPSVGDVFHTERDHCGGSSTMKCKLVMA